MNSLFFEPDESYGESLTKPRRDHRNKNKDYRSSMKKSSHKKQPRVRNFIDDEELDEE